MKSPIFILLLFIVTACSSCSSGSSSNIKETPEQPQPTSLDVKKCIVSTDDNKLEIVTWNVEHFPKVATTTREVANIIKAMNVDVLALQEVKTKSYLDALVELLPGYESAIMVRSDINLAYIYKTSEISINGNPYSILKNKTYELPRTPFVLPIHSKSTDLDILLVNNHFKAYDDTESRARRKAAATLLKNWIDTEHPTDNVIVLGDMNDALTDKAAENVFQPFLEDIANYIFADRTIALGKNKSQWSYPGFPSHIDHILLTNELFDNELEAYTYTFGACDRNYGNIISDHYPVCVVLE